MTSGEVRVHMVIPGEISGDELLATLTNQEKARANRFRFRRDADHWIACRSSLRGILGKYLMLPPCDVPLIVSELGKPLLESPHDHLHFNLSHCSNLALVALCMDGPVGIDLEPINRESELLECEATFCHPAEIAALPRELPARASQLLRIWTAKEAVLKALGTGLSHPPEGIQVHFHPGGGFATSDTPLAGIAELRLHVMDHPALEGYQVSIATTASVSSINITC